MIFAELQYEQDYSDMHAELVDFVKVNFENVQCGLQGDSWIWIFEDNDKVAIDTFTSMKHQVKSTSAKSNLVAKVIEQLSFKYKINIYVQPELEPHEDI